MLQELVAGATEWSASLLLRRNGEVAAIAAVEYTYDAEEYVWPHARERKELRRSHAALPAAHLQLFRALLRGYIGVCNVNYKLRRRAREAAPEAAPEAVPDAVLAAAVAAGEAATGARSSQHGCDTGGVGGAGEAEAGEAGEVEAEAGAVGIGEIAILEVNTRVGGDLAADVSRPIARAFFEALDRLGEEEGDEEEGNEEAEEAEEAEGGEGGEEEEGAAAGLAAMELSVAAAEAEAAPCEAAPVCLDPVYLGPVRDESPRYATPRDAPNWLRPEAAAAPLDFLLRGADSPALQLFLPPPPAAAAAAAAADADTGSAAPVDAASFPMPTPTTRALLPVVLVLPGGGYRHLAPREGAPAARWLAASLGVVAAVPRYRRTPHPHMCPLPRSRSHPCSSHLPLPLPGATLPAAAAPRLAGAARGRGGGAGSAAVRGGVGALGD